MTTPEFGNLEIIDLREAWPHEAHDFTPWLADNLDRLSDAIGITLESEGTEVQVEQFSADIFARNTLDDSFVLIENQLEISDHTHLGQILTYLAGLEARTVILVARDFQEAHLSAIRWLNENTTDQFAFFAVQLLVARIGDSPLAPLFNVWEQPNQWDRHIRAASQERRRDLTPLGQFRSEFWTYYADRYPDDGVRQGFADANPDYPIEDAGLKIRRFLAQKQVGLWITTLGRRAGWDEVAELLQPYLPALEKELEIDPEEMSDSEYEHWETTAHCEILVDTKDCNNWAEATDWLHEHLTIYRRVLSQPPNNQS